MVQSILQRSLSLFLKRQTNILTAAVIIMCTVVFSQILGLIRQRLLVGIFEASNILGIYLTSTKLPDLLFQIIIAGALSSAFIPIFSEYLAKEKEKEAHKLASNILCVGFVVFFLLALVLFIFTPFFLQVINLGAGYTPAEMELMANLTRVVIVSQLLFIVGVFFTALLQSYNHFFIPGIAAAFYNLGIIIGILTLSWAVGIYAPAYGMIIGALMFIATQLPMVRKLGMSFVPSFSFKTEGVRTVFKLMWPRTLSLAVFQLGTIATLALVSFLPLPGRNYVIFDYAQTLAFAPIALFGQAIAQAAFPVLSRERERLEDFKLTFITSFNQMLYLVLPMSALFIVLRIPIVRLIYGAEQFDWNATVLTGTILALLSLSMFAQALVYLVSRGFYALHDTKTPLIVGAITTVSMVALSAFFIYMYQHGVTEITIGNVVPFLSQTGITLNFGIEGIALAYSIASVLNLLLLMFYLDRKVGGFNKNMLFSSVIKILLATFFTGFALYIPIKLLDQLVFDTTRTINLLMLTGISSAFGFGLYLFLTWLFDVKEAAMFILLFKKVGNWREILGKRDEMIEPTRLNP